MHAAAQDLHDRAATFYEQQEEGAKALVEQERAAAEAERSSREADRLRHAAAMVDEMEQREHPPATTAD